MAIQSSKRINWIDWAKALGIFLVIVCHIYYPDDLQYYKLLTHFFIMPFFFFISGYLYKQENGFLKKDFKRLIIPYFAFNLFYYIFTYIPSCLLEGIGTTDPMFFLKKAYLYTMIIPICFPTWFLFALFWSKIATHYLLKLNVFWSILLSFVLAAFGYQFYLYTDNIVPFFVKIPFFICSGLLVTPFMILGYYLKKYDLVNLFYNKRKVFYISFFILIPIYLLGVKDMDRPDYAICFLSFYPFLTIFLSIVGCCLLIMLCRCLNAYSNKFVQKISVGTIVILGFHLNLYELFLALYSPTPNIYISLIMCCLILTICYFLIGLIQKNRILSFLFMGVTLKK